MARPNKQRGFRPISVDGIRYRWQLNQSSGHIEINLEDSYMQRLEVDFGWYDVWLHANDPVRRQMWEPGIVTPAFVEKAIRFGLSHGWFPEFKGPAVRIRYREERFTAARGE